MWVNKERILKPSINMMEEQSKNYLAEKLLSQMDYWRKWKLWDYGAVSYRTT